MAAKPPRLGRRVAADPGVGGVLRADDERPDRLGGAAAAGEQVRSVEADRELVCSAAQRQVGELDVLPEVLELAADRVDLVAVDQQVDLRPNPAAEPDAVVAGAGDADGSADR